MLLIDGLPNAKAEDSQAEKEQSPPAWCSGGVKRPGWAPAFPESARQLSTVVAPQHMVGGAEGVLAALVAGRQCHQHAPALRGGKPDPLQRHQIVDPKLGPAPRQAGGDSTSGRAVGFGNGGSVDTLDLMSEHGCTLQFGKSRQRYPQCVLLLPNHDHGVGLIGLSVSARRC